METTTSQDPGEKPKTTTRTYVVLKLVHPGAGDDGAAWAEVGTAETSTDRQAIEKLTKPDEIGTWVAVPERNWNPRTPELDQPPPRRVWS